jgi:hypothetical protein
MIFNSAQCDRILELVLAHRELWTSRGTHDFGSLFTLGAVSAFGDREEYQSLVSQGNPLMWEHLKEEYIQILRVVYEMTGIPCSYHSKLALPGFQIFSNTKSGGNRTDNGGIIHKDYLWQAREIKDILGIPSVEAEYSATIIFSNQPCYLDFWDDYPNGFRTLEYIRGKLTPHNHQLFHQVPYTGEVGDMRVSMQIRGFLYDGNITLYL